VLAHQPLDRGEDPILDEDQVGDGDGVFRPGVARRGTPAPRWGIRMVRAGVCSKESGIERRRTLMEAAAASGYLRSPVRASSPA
jgi:hypothetical protein